jgi:acetoin utilization protein AcuB
MIVEKRMSKQVVTVSPNLSLTDAISLMKQEKIRHLVVVEKDKLVGLVTQNDLENALPSQATSLSIWEMNYLIEKILVKNVMIKDVVTANEEMPVEEAARLMVDNKISCLPVLRGKEVVGIITETDLFRIFLEVLGARQKGVRVAAVISHEPGTIAKLTQAIYQVGGDILALVTFAGSSLSSKEITLKVQGVEQQKLQEAIEPCIEELLSIGTV